MLQFVLSTQKNKAIIFDLQSSKKIQQKSIVNIMAHPIHPGRKVHFEGSDNFRDLGGYATPEGKSTKWGILYRAGKLSELTEKDIEILTALKIKTIIDFRREDELDKEPDKLPNSNQIKHIHLPIISGINGLAIVEEVINTGNANMDIKGEELMLKANRYYVSKARKQYATLFKLLQRKRNLPLVFHCSAGKDRTGLAAALILHALNIPRETILEDYLESNEHRKEATKAKLNMIQNNLPAKELILPLLEVKRDYLDSAYQEIDKLYGSVSNYLEKGLGTGPEELEMIKENLLE
jgi:protein-tyrosine phosphatase